MLDKYDKLFFITDSSNLLGPAKRMHLCVLIQYDLL